MKPYTNVLTMEIKQSVAEAPDYNTGANGGENFSPAEFIKAVVVRNGMESGKDTVDLQFKTADGKQHVTMLTGALIKMLARTVNLDDGF